MFEYNTFIYLYIFKINSFFWSRRVHTANRWLSNLLLYTESVVISDGLSDIFGRICLFWVPFWWSDEIGFREHMVPSVLGASKKARQSVNEVVIIGHSKFFMRSWLHRESLNYGIYDSGRFIEEWRDANLLMIWFLLYVVVQVYI